MREIQGPLNAAPVYEEHRAGLLERLRSLHEEPKPAQLSNLDLRGLNLAGFDLSDAIMVGTQLDDVCLANANLERTNLNSASLKGADLQNARILNATLEGANLTGANLSRADFRSSSLKNAQLDGTTLEECILAHALIGPANLQGANLRNAVLTSADLARSQLKGADLEGANLDDANLAEACLARANLNRASLARTRLSHADLSCAQVESSCLNEADLTKAVLESARLGSSEAIKATMQGANLRKSNFTKADLSSADLRKTALDGATLKDAKLSSAKLTGAFGEQTNLEGADLSGTNFGLSKFRSSSFLGASLSASSDFDRTDLSGSRFSRYQVEYLKAKSNITTAELLDMDVRHATATLRSVYSGFWQWIHVGALFAFLAPYAFFLAQHYPRSVPSANFDGDGRTLLSALAHYIWSAGETPWGSWTFHWGFLLFCFGIGYNALRAALLWKTKTLELRETSSGLPVDFDLERSSWGQLFAAANIGFRLNLLVVSLHTGHFLARIVPGSVPS